MGNRNKRNVHAYDPATMDRLKNVPLPDKIKCGRCNKFLQQARFSNKQLTDARYAVKYQGANKPFKINCQACTNSGQVVEIECTVCHKTKGLEDFAKVQRKKPDSAKCYSCIEDQLDTDPIEDDRYEDPLKAFDEVSRSAGTYYPEYFTTTTTSSVSDEWEEDARSDDGEDGGIPFSSNFRNANSITATLIESEYDYDGNKTNDSSMQSNSGRSESKGAKSWHTKSNTTLSTSSGFNPNKYGNPATVSSGFNSQKYGHPVGRSTAGSVSGSVDTFNSTFAERSDTTSYKNGWAKIKACKEKKIERPAEDEWESDSSEEEVESDDSDTEI